MSRLQVFWKALETAGFDAAIVSDPTHCRYLTQFSFHDGYLLVVGGRGYLLTDFRYEEAAKGAVANEWEILCPDCGMLVSIAGLLEEGRAHRVAVEEKALSLADFERFQKNLKGVELTAGASKILSEMRICKDADELETIRLAQAITDAAFSHILKAITPNMTEIEVALELEYFMRRNGADGLAFNIIAVSGSASSLPHGVPRPCKLERGFLTMDFGARYKGYCSDMTRTVVLGRADDEMKRLYHTVLQAQTLALDAAAEGVSCRALDQVARDCIENAGYHGRFGHSLGHGVGLLVHEDPRLSSKAMPENVLRRGHVVTVEPGIYLAGRYGCRIEDMIAIDEQGKAINLTSSPKELIELF